VNGHKFVCVVRAARIANSLGGSPHMRLGDLQLQAQADSLWTRIEAAAQASSLPGDVDLIGVEALVEGMITSAPRTNGAVRA